MTVQMQTVPIILLIELPGLVLLIFLRMCVLKPDLVLGHVISTYDRISRPQNLFLISLFRSGHLIHISVRILVWPCKAYYVTLP